MTDENVLDELWVGVKGQSNLEIAGSPRNSFRASPMFELYGGRALFRLGGSLNLPNLDKLQIP